MILVVAYVEFTGYSIVTQETPISSCQNLNSAGIYTLTQNVNSTGTCFSINASDIELDCQGNNISYGTGGGSNAYGINISQDSGNMQNITIKNCNIEKGNKSGFHGYGIFLGNVSQSTIFNNNITTDGTNTNYGIYMFSGSSNNFTFNTVSTNGNADSNIGIIASRGTNNYITDNIVSTNGTFDNFGIYLTIDMINNTVRNNSITTGGTSFRNTGIALFNEANNNTISQNSITTSGTDDNYGMDISTDASNNNISNNVISTSGTTFSNRGIQLFENIGNVVSQNTITTTGGGCCNYGIYLAPNASGNSVFNNVITTNGTFSNRGIYLTVDSSNNTVQDNSVTTGGTQNGNYGIYVFGNTNNIITRNNITTGGTSANYGVYLTTSASGNNITDNIISTQGTTDFNTAILIFSSTDNLVSGNSITTSGTTDNYGMWFFTAERNIFSSNTISTGGNSANHGVNVFNSLTNTISSNSITTTTNSSHGILVDSSQDNVFIENTVNVTKRDSDDFRVIDPVSVNNTAINLTLLRNNVVLSLIANNGSAIKALLSSEIAGLGSPDGLTSFGKSLNITNTTATSGLLLNISYSDFDLGTGSDESSLRIWKHNGTDWINESFYIGLYGVDTVNNKIFVNINNFSSTFGVFGNITAITPVIGAPPELNVTTDETAEGTEVIITENVDVQFTVPIGETVNLSSVSISSNTGKTVVTGLSLPAGVTKSVEVIITPGVSSLCIVDEPDAVTIRLGCKNGVTIACPGSTGQYTCTVSGGKATVSGLSNTVIGTFTPRGSSGVVSITVPISVLDPGALEDGVTRKVDEGDKFRFIVGQESHLLEVSEVRENSVSITVTSTPTITFSIGIGEEKKLDLTDDGVYDFIVRLVSIVDDEAEIFIQTISEPIVKEEAPAPPVPEREKRPIVLTGTGIVIILISIVLIIAIVLWIISRSKTKRKRKR